MNQLVYDRPLNIAQQCVNAAADELAAIEQTPTPGSVRTWDCLQGIYIYTGPALRAAELHLFNVKRAVGFLPRGSRAWRLLDNPD
jgi:hypothetical protein